jgi:hypothetical protein
MKTTNGEGEKQQCDDLKFRRSCWQCRTASAVGAWELRDKMQFSWVCDSAGVRADTGLASPSSRYLIAVFSLCQMLVQWNSQDSKEMLLIFPTNVSYPSLALSTLSLRLPRRTFKVQIDLWRPYDATSYPEKFSNSRNTNTFFRHSSAFVISPPFPEIFYSV